MRKLFLAALLALGLGAQAQALNCNKVDTPSGFTLSCATPGVTPLPPVVTVVPVTPVVPVVPVPPPVVDACTNATDPKFQRAMAEDPLPSIVTLTLWRMNRGLTSDELACARARGVPGMAPPTVIVDGGGSAPTPEFVGFNLDSKSHPYRNTLVAGATYQYVFSTAPGELVELTILEVSGTPDTMRTVSQVRTDAGVILSGPTFFGRHGKHIFTSPGGRVTMFLTPQESGPLGVQRN